MATTLTLSKHDHPDCPDANLTFHLLSILRNLKETISFGLFIPKSLSPHFQAFADSDWAGDPDDRRSVGAYCIYLGSSLIAWTCNQQEALALAAHFNWPLRQLEVKNAFLHGILKKKFTCLSPLALNF